MSGNVFRAAWAHTVSDFFAEEDLLLLRIEGTYTAESLPLLQEKIEAVLKKAGFKRRLSYRHLCPLLCINIRKKEYLWGNHTLFSWFLKKRTSKEETYKPSLI